jgi:hypothetical protein
VAVAAAAIALALVGSLVSAPAASANTRSNFSAVIRGVEVGWTNDHAWLITSYANAITLGSGEVAEIVCDAVSDGGMGPACDYIIEQIVGPLLKNKPRLTNHGIWGALYPENWGRYRTTGGTY